MSDDPFTNRELKEMFKDIRTDVNEIKLQTQKTNGSVADINRWRERINGGAVVAGVFMTMIVMPILIWSVYVLVNINTTVHSSIDDALSAYNITR